MILNFRDTNDNSFRRDYAWHGSDSYCLMWNILDNNNNKKENETLEMSEEEKKCVPFQKFEHFSLNPTRREK